MEVMTDAAAMLEAGDFDKLDKREREAFHAMQERMVQFLLQESNHFQLQFPGLRIDFRFQTEIYQSVMTTPSRVTYSNRVF
jgi:hypothetical protein